MDDELPPPSAPRDPMPESPAARDESAPASPAPASAAPATGDDDEAPNADQVRMALRKVKDPELGLNIVDLGLVYDVAVTAGNVHVDMTLTSPGCPAGPQIMTDVENTLKAMDGVGEVELNLVWSPFWTPERIEPRVRAYMGL